MSKTYQTKSVYGEYLQLVDENKKLKKENHKLKSEVFRLNRQIRTMEDDFSRTLKAMNDKIDAALADNNRLKDEVSHLKSVISNNSNNSSLPPSSDQRPTKSANEYNSREKSSKKSGGQFKHHGITLTKQQIEYKIKNHELNHAVHYVGMNKAQQLLSKYTKKGFISKYIIDMEVNLVAHEYRFPSNLPIPNDFKSDVMYGTKLKTFAVELLTEGNVSIERTRYLINNLTDNTINISSGSIYNFYTNFANKCQASVDNIKESLLCNSIICTDATNITVNGKQTYIRNYSTADTVLYTSLAKKNIAELSSIPLMRKFVGIFVHDHETAMYNFGTTHAECNAHIIRYLTKIKEETGNNWASNMIAFLVSLNKHRDRLMVASSSNTFTKRQLREYSKRYDEIIAEGTAQNKYTKHRYAKREEKALLHRLAEYKKPHLLFLYNFDVPFTNNMSERDLRKCKNKQKISGGFRKQSGKQYYCNIMSVIETMKRRNINPFDGIEQILAGNTIF